MSPAWHILVVDDDPVFSETLARALSRRGQKVTVAMDGEAALAPQEKSFDAAVLDLRLSTDSGLRLITPLIAAHPGIRILLLTGYASIATAVEAIKLGALNYLAKPADADQVLAAFVTTEGDPSTPVNVRPLSVNRLEWEHIQRVLRDNDGNISATARQLGMHRRTLQRKLAKRPVRF